MTFINKAQLIEKVAIATGWQPAQVKIIVDTALSLMADTLATDKITLSGFGTFALRTSKAHMARNPKTGAPVSVSEKKVLSFQCASTLKHKLNS